MDYQTPPPGKDPQLWNLASRRASFKTHLGVYIVVNAFLWILWAINGSQRYGNGIPWPVWSTFGWGIGLVFHYIGAYVNNGYTAVEKEYEKLQQKRSQS